MSLYGGGFVLNATSINFLRNFQLSIICFKHQGIHGLGPLVELSA